MADKALIQALYTAAEAAVRLRAPGRISGPSGHVRPVSDGARYPALNRLRAAGLCAPR
jgi:hypothetical protein